MDAILYVDDEPDLLEIGRLFLQKCGQFEVDIITSASAALDLIRLKDYEAIVSDYQMPGMDGIAFLKEVRSGSKDIPFILFTGRGREEVVIEALNSGADFYLQKGGDPISQFTELAHKIRQAVQQRRREANIRNQKHREVEILNFLPDATFAIDTEGIVIAWNRAMEQMTGIAAPQILGKGDYEYAIPFYRERRPLLIDLVLDEDTATTTRYPQVERDGRILRSEQMIPHMKGGEGASLWFTASPLYGDQNNVIGAIESIRDISDKRAAQDELLEKNEELMASFEQITAIEEEIRQSLDELTLSHEALLESEEKYRRIVDTASEGIWAMDRDLSTTFVNQRMADILGYTREEMMGRTIDSFMLPEELSDHLERIDQRKQGRSEKYERKFVCKNATVVWVLVSVTPLITRCGEFDGSFAMCTDITERKLNELALRESEDQFRSVIENLQDIYYRTDEKGTIIMASPSAARVLGYDTIGEVVGTPVERFWVYPECRTDMMQRIREEEGIFDYEILIRKKDGTSLPASVTSMLYRDSTGSVRGVEGIIRDISKRKATENALKESERKYRTLFESAGDAIYLLQDDQIITCNARTLQMYRCTREQIINKTPFSLSPPLQPDGSDSRQKGHEKIQLARSGEPQFFEWAHCRSDGTIFYVEVSLNRVEGGGAMLVQAIIRDITERKRVEEALRESEDKYRILLHESNDPIFSFYPDGTYRYVNRAFAEGVGRSVGEIVGRKIHDVFPPDEAEKRFSALRGVFSTGEEKIIEVRVPHGEGDRYYLTTITPIRNERDLVISVICSSKEITERKQAEKALMESEERYRAIFSESPIAVELHDVSGALVDANAASVSLFGVDGPQELMGFDLFTDPDLTDEQKERLRSGEAVRYQAAFDFERMRTLNRSRTLKTGVIWLDVLITPLGRSIGGYLMQVQEITERKRAEDALRKANRQLNLMTSITRHDINNRITASLGYLNLAEMEFTDPALGEYFRKMEAATKAIQSQIEFTKVYQDLGTQEPQWQDIEKILPTSLMPETMTLTVDLKGLFIFADTMLEKVFSNLMDNSIRHGQRVTEIRVSSIRRGDGLTVVWEDDGVGVAAGEKEAIFERGFGKNTGLGLFLVREILSLTDICIQEIGEPGKGVRFEITVPKGAWRCAGAGIAESSPGPGH